jgi:poly-beta-1,6-N-acetyl-D-glucosamine N-deacetylase
LVLLAVLSTTGAVSVIVVPPVVPDPPASTQPLPAPEPPAASPPASPPLSPPAAVIPPAAKPVSAPRVAVIIYHQVDAAGSGLYTVSPARLHSDLAWLLSQGWRALHLEEFAAWMAGRLELTHDSFLLTFDDGYEEMARQALPVLSELGVPAVLFLTTGRVDEPGRISAEAVALLVESRLVTLANHTHDLHHEVPGPKGPVAAVTVTDMAVLREDLLKANGIIADLGGDTPTALAWPYGKATPEAVAVAAQEFSLIFGTRDAFVRRGAAQDIPRFGMDYRSPEAVRALFSR